MNKSDNLDQDSILDVNVSDNNENGNKKQAKPQQNSRIRKSLENTLSQNKSDFSAHLDFSQLSLIINKENIIESETDLEMIENHENGADMSAMEEIQNKENSVLNLKPLKSRGRRSMENIEPERKSARLATKALRLPSNPEDSEQTKKTEEGKRLWKNNEKIQLLTGLKSHGSKQYKAVASFVPTKSQDVTKAYIRREKRNHLFITKTVFKHNDGTEDAIEEGEKFGGKKGKKPKSDSKQTEAGPSTKPEGRVEEKLIRRKKNNPVEQWIQIIEKNDEVNCSESGVQRNYSSVLPSSLNWIANNELHPAPEDCGGVDYRAIYKYLACLCQGEAPPDMDPPTAAKVLTLLPMLAGVVKKMDLEKEKKWLERYRGSHSSRSYEREEGFDTGKESVKNIESLGKFPGLNPMGIDAEVCVDRVVTISNGL